MQDQVRGQLGLRLLGPDRSRIFVAMRAFEPEQPQAQQILRQLILALAANHEPQDRARLMHLCIEDAGLCDTGVLPVWSDCVQQMKDLPQQVQAELMAALAARMA